MTSSRAASTLVLGGSGFLGVHVVRAALARGDDVASASREPVSSPAIAGVERARAIRTDALRAGEIERVLDELHPLHVIVCTALSRIDQCEAYPGLARALNVDLPARIAAWTARNHAKLIFISTDLVFGADLPRRGGFIEQDEPGPLSVYGRTKVAGELAVIARDERALVVRLPLLHGDSAGRGAGASDSLIAAVARGERPVLFTDETRSPLDVAIAARALVELTRRDIAGILHVAGAEPITRHELGLRVLRAAGWNDDDARARVRASTRAEAQLSTLRPEDASLCSDRARAVLDRALWIAREP